MNDVHANGEIKKIFLSKPIENAAVTIEPTTSPQLYRPARNFSGDQVRIPPRRHMPPVDKQGDEHLTNHRKQRYWNSWEELYLVELWRRYKDELKLINVPLPVYRKMMIAMRNRNMLVNAQDCRRKINTLNSRYKQELLRTETTGCKSEWRLFPLIHCVLQPKIKEFDPWHENAIIKKMLDKLPKPPEATAPILNNIQNNSYQTSQPQIVTANISVYKPRNSYQTSILNASVQSSVNPSISLPNNSFSSPQHSSHKSSILPFRNITMEKIEQLRQDNNRLAKQRDDALKSLHMEEDNFRCFEEFIRAWTVQKEAELKRIQLITLKINAHMENGENQSA